MQEATILRAYNCYGLGTVQLLGKHKGYRNTSYPAKLPNGEIVSLILYKSETGMRERIQYIHRVSNQLKDVMPVRTPWDSRILMLKVEETVRYAGLYTYLPGATIPWEAYTKHHIKLLGMAMGHMHAALTNLQPNNPPLVADEYMAICQRMTLYFTSSGVQKALQQKLHTTISMDVLNLYQTILKTTKKLPCQRMLHMDFVRGNVLFDKVETVNQTSLQIGNITISGIVDLEKTAYGHPAFDIARTLAFLLVDSKYKSPEKTRKYFLNSGYVKRGKQKIPNITYTMYGQKIDVLEILIDMFLVYDFYKFLRHNPYESLSENEHFIRTRAMLLQKGVLQAL